MKATQANVQRENMVELADELLKKGNIKESAEVFRRSLKKDGGEISAQINLAKKLFEEKKFEHAKTFLEIIIANKKKEEAYFLLSAVYKKKSNYKEALKTIEEGIVMSPQKHPTAHIEAAKLALTLKDENKAFTHYKIAVEDIDNKEALSFLSDYFYKRNAYHDCLRYMKRLIKIETNNYAHYQKAGYCFLSIKEYEKSVKMFERAIELSPCPKDYKKRIKKLRSKKLEDNYKDINKAQIEFEKRIRENEKDQAAYFDLGNIEIIKGNFEKAAAYFEKAKSLSAKA